MTRASILRKQRKDERRCRDRLVAALVTKERRADLRVKKKPERGPVKPVVPAWPKRLGTQLNRQPSKLGHARRRRLWKQAARQERDARRAAEMRGAA